MMIFPGSPGFIFNDVAVHDCQLRRMTTAYKDAQNRLLEGQDLPRTYLAHHELESVIITEIITIMMCNMRLLLSLVCLE